MQNNRWLQALIVLLVIIASAWLAGQVWMFVIQFSNVILLFVLSWLLAFILRPLARWLTARGLPFTLSVAVVYLALAVAFTLVGFLLVPLISQQISDLIANFDSNVSQI
ncbi:MAG: AI-2E family transporter, partial [Chloroflexia bacterium]